jgi:hypothetical protein
MQNGPLSDVQAGEYIGRSAQRLPPVAILAAQASISRH